MKEFIKINKYYLITILLMLLTFILIKIYLSNDLLTFDTYLHDKLTNFVNNSLVTNIYKVISFLGSVYFYLILLITIIFINKKLFYNLSIPLVITWSLSFIIKNIIRRERPLTSLITKPSDFSFPSGHTVCSVLLYGLIIYFINKSNINKNIKIFINIFLTLLIILIGCSRVYLGVHFVSDVLAGFLLGTLSLVMFIRCFERRKA